MGRVLIVTDSFSGRVDGISASADGLAGGLVDTGHTVGVVAARRLGAGPQARTDIGYWGVPAVPSFLDGYLMSLPSLRRMRRIIEGFRPDVVSVQTLGPVGVAGLIVARGKGLRTALSWHTDFEGYLDRYPLGWLHVFPALVRYTRNVDGVTLRGVLRRTPAGDRLFGRILSMLTTEVDLVVAPSAKAAARLTELRTGAPVFVLPTGVELGEISGLPAPGPPPREGPTIVHVGRLSREKGLPFLLRAMEEVAARRPDATLVLVGPCHDRPVRALLRRYERRLGERLVLTGAVPRRALLDVYTRADVFVTASTTETQGISLWEAHLAGLPVVVRDEELCDALPDGPRVRSGAREPEELSRQILAALDEPREAPAQVIGPTAAQRARLFMKAVTAAEHPLPPVPFEIRSGEWSEAR